MRQIKSLLWFEFLRLFRFPILELIIASITFFSCFNYLTYHSWGTIKAKAEVGFISKSLTVPLLGMLYYPLQAFIYAILSSFIAHTISSGFMRTLLSYPFKRRDVFLVEFLVVFLPPLIVSFLINIALYAFFFPSLPIKLSWIAKFTISFTAVISCYFFLSSLCYSLSLLLKSPIPSLLASLTLIQGTSFIAQGLRGELKHYLPPFCFHMALLFNKFHYLIPCLVLSTLLFLASYVYFTRRFEI